MNRRVFFFALPLLPYVTVAKAKPPFNITIRGVNLVDEQLLRTLSASPNFKAMRLVDGSWAYERVNR